MLEIPLGLTKENYLERYYFIWWALLFHLSTDSPISSLLLITTKIKLEIFLGSEQWKKHEVWTHKDLGKNPRSSYEPFRQFL